MDVIGAIASAAPRKGMNDLHQKIDKYVYEIRMIEIDEYRYCRSVLNEHQNSHMHT